MESKPQIDPDTPSHGESRAVRTVDATIPVGEFLVYYAKSPDNVRCDPSGNALDGRNEAGRLFPSLDQARAHASEKARGAPNVGTGVYDHKWKILAQFENEAALRREAKRRKPARLALWSTVFLFAGALFLWWEVRSGWTAMVGFLIGSRLLLSGTLKFTEAIMAVRDQRRVRKAIRDPDEAPL